MKSIGLVLSLLAICACTDQKKEPAVDQTRTTSAIVVQPTLHDSHAAEPTASDQNMSEQEEMDMDVDEIDMSGVTRDGG